MTVSDLLQDESIGAYAGVLQLLISRLVKKSHAVDINLLWMNDLGKKSVWYLLLPRCYLQNICTICRRGFLIRSKSMFNHKRWYAFLSTWMHPGYFIALSNSKLYWQPLWLFYYCRLHKGASCACGIKCHAIGSVCHIRSDCLYQYMLNHYH